MSNRSGLFWSAVFALLLLLGASASAASPAAVSDAREARILQWIEEAVSGWFGRFSFDPLLGIRGGSAAPPLDPPTEPVPISSAEPVEPTNSEPAAEGGPHWDPDG